MEEKAFDVESPPVRSNISRSLLYLLFLGFILVQVFEGLVLNNTSHKNSTDEHLPKYTNYNFATTYVLDSLLRILIALVVLQHQKRPLLDSFRKVSLGFVGKLLCIRAGLQFGELLSAKAAIMLTSASNSVIQNARIPLVGFIEYFLYQNVLTRDQYIYALTILPLAASFTITGASWTSSSIGYITSCTSLVLVAFSNVFVENVLQQDLQKTHDVWEKQLLNAVVDFPVMIAAYVIDTAFEIYMSEVPNRTFNPFDEPNRKEWYWVVAIGINGGIWGLLRLSILNYTDAVWLNLLCILVMGIVWIAEQIQDPTDFLTDSGPVKLLTLFALTIVLVGYELAAKENLNQER